MEYHVYWLLKSPCFELFGDENKVFFELKSWWENYIYWLLESSCFELFRGGKYGLFLSQKVDRKMILTDFWEIIVLNFSKMGDTVFFELKSWWKDYIYWLLRSSSFKLFRDGKYGLSLNQKIDGKMIFSWSILTFHGIPGLMVFRSVT